MTPNVNIQPKSLQAYVDGKNAILGEGMWKYLYRGQYCRDRSGNFTNALYGLRIGVVDTHCYHVIS
jgi:hypothetical protein